MHQGFRGIVHFLWADSDCGLLDLLAISRAYALCGTFHQPANVLREIIRFPARLRRFDAVILMSETQKGFFIDCGVPDDSIHVIHHGVDTEFFQPADRPTKTVFTVLSVGTYSRNFRLLYDVCKQMEFTPRIDFRIVASESIRPLFAECANVTFLSGISDEQLLKEYHNASCFLLTAEEATANNALLEALACGIPVLAEDIGGVSEYVTPQCAELVARRDAVAIVEALISLQKSPQRCDQMGKAARHRAEELDWKRVADHTVTLYRALSRKYS